MKKNKREKMEESENQIEKELAELIELTWNFERKINDLTLAQ